ncbi:MAG TPA: glycosyltransferase family 4 protein [Methanobacterium sp.]|jgi:glycosyltransferase involved in cell wall biosynthesis|nr:glycosyltransferase family 4 protein [Methanobacterium sp.]HOI40054.1 glycosyltransferase family 4 protein [Methanobacterium sp.]
MKILSTHISTPENNAEWWRISNIAKIMGEAGHDVDLVHYCGKSKYDNFKEKNQFPNDKFIITSQLGVYFKHLKILRENKYDLVYANTGAATFCSLSGRLTKVPLVFDMHGDLLQELLLRCGKSMNPKFLANYLLLKIMDYANLKGSNKIICVSNRMIDYLHTNKGVALDKMDYVTNGVDLDFFTQKNHKVQELKQELGLEEKLIFGYLGGFQSWQGVENLINSALTIDDDEIAFLIVGGQEKPDNVANKNIIFIPKINRLEVPNYYSLCDVLILPRPSHLATEMAAPTKFAEYTSMGKPVLTSNVGDAADLVTKYNSGIVVKDNSVDNMVEGINQFKDLNPTSLRKMGKNSRKLAETEFDWRLVGKNLLKSLEKIDNTQITK